MEILELPDYKAKRYEIEKYLDEPLFEYVWKVADMFMPDYDGEDRCASRAPIIFANRYIASRLTDDEKFARYQEMYPNNDLESAQKYYAKQSMLDTSFKEKYFKSAELLKTLNAFHIDLNKFWYLLLFVNDIIEDTCTNAPEHESSERDKVNEMALKISEATEFITKNNGRKSYATRDEYTLSVLKASIKYFIRRYNLILNTSKDNATLKARLRKLGLEDSIKDYVAINFDEKVTLEKSHKTRLFAAMFQFFLENKEADREFVKKSTEKISTDKLLLISRLTYIVGLQDQEYYEQFTNDSKENRKLSNLLSRYRDEPLPPMIGRLYSGWF